MKWPFSRSTVEDLALFPLDRSHVRALSEIHGLTFSRQWSDGEFEELLSKPNVFGWHLLEPADRGGRMAGFALLRHAADEAEVLTVAVHPSWQGQGAGRRLMDAAMREAHALRLKSLFLEVDESNVPARALYRKLGFEQVAKRPDYYQHQGGQRTTALVMRRDVN